MSSIDSFHLSTDFAVGTCFEGARATSHPFVAARMRTIPDHGQHLTRFYGAYANRTRQTLFQKDLAHTQDSGSEHDTDTPSTTSSPSRACWARLIKKLFEVDPLLWYYLQWCGCGAPWDLEATPNFAAEVEEGDLPWPPRSPMSFPLKDW